LIVTPWPKKPFIYQINTWVWLDRLSRTYETPLTLESVPDDVLNELAALNVDAIWLMGVWHRSPATRASALRYIHEYRSALPDITPDDVPGSPYAIGMYQVDGNLGGRTGLANFRKRLAERGLKLILDYVPNHVSTDHPWVSRHPDWMVQGKAQDLRRRKDDFFSVRDSLGQARVIAHGRDPYFPGWIDTAQINAFNPEARQATVDVLLDIAEQCDGVRCDMAMLFLNDVFRRTWGNYVHENPASEYWSEVIPPVKAQKPDFLFMAEVYWDMEYRLLELGFDYCYDKRLYDRIRDDKIASIREHLVADARYQRRLTRFIENHDEQRAAAHFGIPKSRMGAVLICTLPGATLLHDGQFEGRRVKLPVQIGRQPEEKLDMELKQFYQWLLAETRDSIYQRGDWVLYHPSPAKDNGTHNNLIAYGWRCDQDYRLIVVNLSGTWSQGHIALHLWSEMGGANWTLHDALNNQDYTRGGGHLLNPGLYVDLAPYHAHLFHIERH
jgi:glycosidase